MAQYEELVRYVVLLFTMQGVTRGQDPGPSYKMNRACQVNSQCNEEANEVCWWSFDGCPKGQCQCHPKYTYPDASGRCLPLKMGNDLCNPNDKCPAGMSCKAGRCQCDSGFMTTDMMFCLTSTDKMLGEACFPGRDKCYQRRAYHDYSTNDMTCSRGYCRCKDGLKEDNGRCRRWNVGESGCSKDHHCQGGALCLDGSCKCPSGYMTAAGGHKCVKIGAEYDLRTGSICDEFNERGYCARDLICHRCAETNHATCVRYLPSDPHTGGYVSNSPYNSLSIVTLLGSLFVATVVISSSTSSSR